MSGSLTVNPHLAMGVQPVAESKYVGEDAGMKFSITSGSGFSPYTYQWYKSNTTGSPVLSVGNSGATTTTLTLTSLTTGQAGNYIGFAYDTPGDRVFANTAALNVQPRISISAQPQDASSYVSSPFSFSVAAADGYAPLSYQWYRDTGTTIAGATLSFYSKGSASTGDAGIYYVNATDSLTDLTTSNTASLTVTTP